MIKKVSLLKGSFILLLTLNFFNLLNFIFNVLMARTLSLSEYGELTALINLVVLFAVFSESVQTIVAKYVSENSSEAQSRSLLTRSLKKAFSVSLLIYLGFLLVSIFLSYALKINYGYLALSGLMIIFSFILPVPRGVLQGKQRFTSLGMNFISEGFVKLVFSLIFVLIGFRVGGALLGMILGVASAFCLSLLSLSKTLSSTSAKAKIDGIYDYSRPVFFVTLSIVLFLTLDMVLAKIFFPPEIAGAYAIASTIAKIIFIGTQPLSKALFPISVATKKQKDSSSLLKKAMLYLSFLLAIALLAVWLFPELIISLYAGRQIVTSSAILLYITIAMCLLSYTNLILMYALSRGLLKRTYLLIFPIIVQIVLLSFFSSNLITFSIALITSSAFFFWCSTFFEREK